MPSKQRTEQAISAGGVVYRVAGGALEIVLCGRTGPGTWNLPKGTPNPGETLEQTAAREVREETGLDIEVEQPLGHIEYWFSRPSGTTRYHKRVHFFLMRVTGGDLSLHDPEFDEVRWFPAEEAARRLTFPNEASMVRCALDALALRGTGHG